MLVPGEQRLLTVRTQTIARTGGMTDVFTAANDATLPEGSAEYLTGDGGVVLLGATLSYRVTDGAAYYLAEEHVAPALQRLFAASAVDVLATRKLDDVMVAEPVRANNLNVQRAAEAEARRQALRGDLVEAVNRRLADLAAHGASLGVEVARIDLDPSLPPQAKIAYDQVLVAAQMAEQGIADARTEATRTLQVADRERDRLLEAAKASANERVGEARSRTASILAVQASMTPTTRGAVLDQVYRDQLADPAAEGRPRHRGGYARRRPGDAAGDDPGAGREQQPMSAAVSRRCRSPPRRAARCWRGRSGRCWPCG